MPQPYLVPVMPRWSRRTHRRGVSRSASTDMGLPLTFRVIIKELLEKNPPQLFSALPADLCRGCARGVRPRNRNVPRRAHAVGPRTPARLRACLGQWCDAAVTVVLEVAIAAAAAAPAAMTDTMVAETLPDDDAGTAPCDAPPAA